MILFLVLPLIFFFSNCKSTKKKDYNVVLIVIDTLRSDHLPMYGYKKNTAPFLQELSKQGTLFENAFSASSWTSPATASIFTSLYPFQHGVLMGMLAIRSAQAIDPSITVNRIPEKIVTIAEVMKNEGYQTYGIADNLNIGERQGFTQGFDKFLTFMYKQAEHVNDTVKTWHKQLTSNGKYFLYLHYMDPHAPYHPRDPWYEKSDDKKLHRISSYDSEINYVDQHIKDLFQLYRWDKNTIVIITSDHGEGLWDHGLMGHGKTLFREEIQVPLIVYLPEQENREERRIATNVCTIDILPTVRNLLGLEKDPNNEGVSLLPLMDGKETDLDKRNIYSYLWVKMESKLEWKSTVYKKWHFAMKLPDVRHIFSLIKDQKEHDNLITDAAAVAFDLEKRFNQFQANSKKYKQQSRKVKLDKEKTNKLKSLGYVN